MSEGRIIAIETVDEFTIQPIMPMTGANGARMGLGSMTEALMGRSNMEGYCVITDEHRFYVLISSQQSCCENYGYISSEDDFGKFIGNTLLAVNLTDTSLMKEDIEELRYLDAGGVQFVDFETTAGKFQLAVYNGHNGYYGHGILVAKDDEILLNETL